jgi:hypothetical protein
MRPRVLVFLLLPILALVFVPARADACTCVTGAPVCETFWKTDVVFSGEVLDVSPTQNPSGERFQSDRRVRLRVLQSWRGQLEQTVELTTGSGGGDCGYDFQKGVRYLVFAHHWRGGLTTSICSRTTQLADAAEDLEYLKTALEPAAAGRIFGAVRYRRDANSFTGTHTPIPGYEIQLSNGRQTWKASSDKDGRYEFTGMLAGTYAISLTPASGEHAYGPSGVALADPRGCAAADFYVVPDGRISVRLLDPAGRPRRDVSIDLIDLEAVAPGRPYSGVSRLATDGAGRIEWQQLGAKRYVLAVNAMRPPNTRQPYPTTFFPGVATLAEAKTIEIGLGDRVELGDWILAATLGERRIAGQVTWPDGKPAARATVVLSTARTSQWSLKQVDGAVATTDEDGRFTLVAHEGIVYEVRAHANVGESQWSAVREFTAGTSSEPVALVLGTRSR